MKWHASLSAVAVLLASCASSAPKIAGSLSEQVCQEPRPQVCTMEYNPVCARLEDGLHETYSNGCSACADSRVVAWQERACGE